VARFALGGDDRPSKGDAPNYPAWLCAARSCDPARDWSDDFAEMRVHDTHPGGVKPARYSWATSHTKHSHDDMHWKMPEFDFSVSVEGRSGGAKPAKKSLLSRGLEKLKAKVLPDWKTIPTIAANCHTEPSQFGWSELSSVWISQWLPYVWPQNPTGAYFRSARELVRRIDDDASSWSPSHGLFDALFVKGRPWGESGHLVLCLGLISKDADAKGLAIDALIEGIDSRAFHPERFGEIMQKLSAGEWIKLNRIGASLTQVALASPLHAAMISEATQLWLQRFDLSQRNAFYALESLSHAQASSGAPLNSAMRANLETLSGKSKAAKLAKDLLANAD